jgi:hypothetical protein
LRQDITPLLVSEMTVHNNSAASSAATKAVIVFAEVLGAR